MLAEPLLPPAPAAPAPAAPPRWQQPLLGLLGLGSPDHARLLSHLALHAQLCGAALALGRAVGPAVYVEHVGTAGLTAVMFLSGLTAMATSVLFAHCWAKARPTAVSRGLVLVSASTLVLLMLPLLLPSIIDVPYWLLAAAAGCLFLAEDTITWLLMMHAASLAQAMLGACGEKRLLYLVQLGASFGALAGGALAASLAELVSPAEMLGLQLVLLLALLWPTVAMKKHERVLHGSDGCDSPTVSADEAGCADGWWRQRYLLAMAVWTGSSAMFKTVVEYQYYVFASSLNAEGMIRLSGYLFAAAGLLAALLQAQATSALLRHMGMLAALLCYPVLFSLAATGMLTSPGVLVAFCGRLMDLTLRWSLDGAVKPLLWLALPRVQQVYAKPWVEGAVARASACVSALLIGLWLVAAPDGDDAIPSLSIMSLFAAAAGIVSGMALQRQYTPSFSEQLERRELQLCDTAPLLGAALASEEPLTHAIVPQLDGSAAESVLCRLREAPSHVQLFILRQLGEALPAAAWRRIVEGFSSLSAVVQVNVLEKCSTRRACLPDLQLLRILEASMDVPLASTASASMSPASSSSPTAPVPQSEVAAAVLVVVILTVAERGLPQAKRPLMRLLESRHSRVRAAAAAATLRLGWGGGLEQLAAVALSMLEQMCGVMLLGASQGAPRLVSAPTTPSRVARLRRAVAQLTEEWEVLVISDLSQAMAVAVEITRLKAELHDASHADVGSRHHRSICARDGAQGKLGMAHGSMEAGGAVLGSGEMNGLACSCGAWSPAAGGASDTCTSLATPPALTVPEDAEVDAAHGRRAWRREEAAPRLRDAIAATEMLRHLPPSMLADDSLLWLLSSASYRVRKVALPLMLAERCGSPLIQSLVDATVRCLSVPEISHQARTTLHKLLRGADAHEAKITRLAIGCSMRHLKEQLHASRSQQSPAASSLYLLSQPSPSRAPAARGVLAFLEAVARRSGGASLADDMLTILGECHDGECAHEVLDTLLRLKASGRGCALSGLEPQVRAQALRLVMGLAAADWLTGLLFYEKRVGPETTAALGAALGIDSTGNHALAYFCKLCTHYTAARLEMQRLRLIKLSLLCVDMHAMASVPIGRPYLTSPEGTAATLEVLERYLDWRLSQLVIPLLDESPVESKLQVAEGHFADTRVPPHCPPPWLASWLLEDADPLGAAIAPWGDRLSEPMRADYGMDAALHAPLLAVRDSSDRLMARMVALRESRLFRELPALHLVALAQRSQVRNIGKGGRVFQRGESYFVLSGSLRANANEVFTAGEAVQELGCISEELPPMQLEASAESQMLVLACEDVQELAASLSPEFGFALWQALVQLIPKPSQPGAPRQPAPPSDTESSSAKDGIEPVAIEIKDETPEVSPGRTFSLVERVLLLREVKLLRYIDSEHLSSLAQIAMEQRVPKGGIVCKEGSPASATLIIVAQGLLELTQTRPVGNCEVIRHLGVGDSLGNTSLVSDSCWEYTATAAEDTWTLVISRQDLVELLRGRRELAHSVFSGVCRSFVRRLRCALDLEARARRERQQLIESGDRIASAPPLSPPV